ncbi:MAG TPA: phage portal protein [Tepidisphaeraceae bacterium]|jgi:hypothetical protein
MQNDLAKLNLDHPMLASVAALRAAVERLLGPERRRCERLWAYYRNPTRLDAMLDAGNNARPYRQAQEWGLPARVTGSVAGADVFDASLAAGVNRKEVVIENDIGWRVDSIVDFLFGRAIVLNSTAADPARRTQIEAVLRAVLAANGGLIFLQQLALLGAVYGSVDVLVKFVPDLAATPAPTAASNTVQSLGGTCPSAAAITVPSPAESASDESVLVTDDGATPPADSVLPAPGASHPSPRDIDRLARCVRLEIVEPTRALPLLSPCDCRVADAFATVYTRARTPSEAPALAARQRRGLRLPWARPPLDPPSPQRVVVIELVTPTQWQRYEDDMLVAEGPLSLGRLPLVHVQNTPDPLSYVGASDVEPLLPLQDELNTRLSDRAHRIAMTSFRMYLGKGIENFTDVPITPGQMWQTDNPAADVVEFGGDASCPSEESHISNVREAIDKLSGVSPVAAGAIKGKIGNLTSAAALRVTMMALLSRTERKRGTYGIAIAQMCELALAWLDHAGLFPTTPDERGIDIYWSNPLPTNEIERLEEAKAKVALGVPVDVVLRELGYGDQA